MNLKDITASRRGFLGLSLGSLAAASISAPAQAQRIATKARIVIVGAGAAGTALANRLTERLEGAEITIIDARAEHLYQPGLTLVAAGLKPAAYVQSKTTDWLPQGITLVSENAAAIDPITKMVATTGGQKIAYDYLVVATGLVLDHAAIEGFSLDMVGSNGIGALYAGADYAAKTWDAARKFTE
jgi:sulfide:quinone oxidoreductase